MPCLPAIVVAKFLEPLALAAGKKKSEAAGRVGRAVLLAHTVRWNRRKEKTKDRGPDGGTGLPRSSVLAAPSIADFGKERAGIALETRQIAGCCPAVVESLARYRCKARVFEFETNP